MIYTGFLRQHTHIYQDQVRVSFSDWMRLSRYILFVTFKVVNDIRNPTIIFNSYLQKDALSLYRVDSKVLTRCLRVFHL